MIHDPRHHAPVRRSARVGIQVLTAWLVMTAPSQGQVRSDGSQSPGPDPAGPSRPGGAPKAVARLEGTAAPGQAVVLRGDGSLGDDLRFRWVQSRGPRAILESPSAASTRFIVPDSSEPLGFLLVVTNGRGMDTVQVEVMVDRRGAVGGGGTSLGTGLKADAGDDLMGLVGRQLTLTGLRSEPKGRLAFRWIQVGGPQVRLKLEEGHVYSFVPQSPGIYRFALVVAADGAISEPDFVNVSIGAATPVGAVPSPTASPVATGESSEPTPELARASLATIQGGVEASGALASAFQVTADRMDLYRTFGEAYGELARRVDEVLPRDPNARAVWNERLFLPLSARLVEVLLAEGLDLRSAEGQGKPLNAAQRAQLADQFRSMAEGFGALATPR